jgi:DNA-binding CsgD family transcriptional regulator
MSGLWSLLALVVAVAAGLTTATVSAILFRSRQTAFFRYFLVQVLLFDLLILGGLAFRFVDLYVRQQGMRPHPGLLPGMLAALAALKLGWLYAFMAMTLVLPGQEPPAPFLRRFAVAATVFFGTWTALLAASVATHSFGATNALIAVMELGVLGGATAASTRLVVRAASLPPGPRRRSITILGGVYLAAFAVMIGSLTLGWIGPSGETPGQVLFNSTLLVLCNLLPLGWILRFQPTGPIATPDAMDRYGITPREREIIERICAGSTNQEIADRLFISLATVKDHNYNIFRKTGVRNRVELANLLRKEGSVEASPCAAGAQPQACQREHP